MRVQTALVTLFLFSSALMTDALAEVYKRTNPDGSVEFSDVPSKIDAEPIELKPSSSYSPPPLPSPTASAPPKSTTVKYESVTITSPANDAAIRDNAGNLSVTVGVKPALNPGHIYILLMDGKSVGEGSAGKFQLTNVARGTHTFIGQVADKNKKMLLQSRPVTVHLMRATVKRP